MLEIPQGSIRFPMTALERASTAKWLQGLTEQEESVITALLLAGMLDPNCVPRHRVHQRAFPYHAITIIRRRSGVSRPVA